jgi:putative ABC transport system permease protein
MKPRWQKVLHDLIDNRGRTVLVVLSIAVGVLSIGMIAGAYVIISHDLPVSYSANIPTNIELQMRQFEEDALDTLRDQKSVALVEGRRVENISVRLPGAESWITLDVTAFDDFEDNAINLLIPLEGSPAPEEGEILLEKKALEDLDISVGDTLEFQLPDGSIKALPVAGIVQDTAAGAGDFLASPFAYITMDTLPTLGYSEQFNRALVVVSEDGDDLNHIRTIGAELKDFLEKNGELVVRQRFSETHTHPLAKEVNAILGILLALGVLIVFLSSSLIANTLSALLTQHLRYIGVIKLVGGQRRQVFRMYFTLILAFSVLALLIAIPLGGQAAYELADFIAGEMNFSLLEYRIVPLALVVQVLVGLIVPLIAGLVPVLTGSRITVLRALSGDINLAEDLAQKQDAGDTPPGQTHQVRRPLLDRISIGGLHIPRPFVISLRNTFRKKSRLALTLFTLTMGGAIFISVFNVRVSLHHYIDQISQYFVADIWLDFNRGYRLDEVEMVAHQVEGVSHVEGWQFISGELLDADGAVLENINIFGPPTDSQLVDPILLEGRWIQDGDVRRLAISEAALKYFPELHAGDAVNLKIAGREELWQVVGIFKFVDREGILGYVPDSYLSIVNHNGPHSYSYRLVTDRHDPDYQTAKSHAVDKIFRDLGYKVREVQSGTATLDTAVESLDTVVIFLLIMAVATAVVGSMGLAGTMSMNVMERTREIGVMRAIGADDRSVMRTVIAEGVVIGVVSLVLAVGLSIPITHLLAQIVSLAVFQSPIEVVLTWVGYVIWFLLVLVFSAVASIIPARSAARLTIREVLAYE